METGTTLTTAYKPTVSRWRFGQYSIRYNRREITIAVILALMVFLLTSFALTVGKFPISSEQIIAIALGEHSYPLQERVLVNIRLPRILTALCVGAALGVSGAIFQSVSNNPLGSPDIIGFTSGAATGALLQIIMYRAEPWQVSAAAVAGGMATALVVYFLSRKQGQVGRYRLILTGIGVGSILTALNGLLLVKGDLDDALTAGLWLSGSLHSRTWQHVVPVFIALLVCIPLIKLLVRSQLMSEMGNDIARQLGVRVESVQFAMMLLAVVLAAMATGAAGPIAFIALAAPQLVRRLRASEGLPIISSALMGACLLVCADLLTMLLPWQLVLPIGRVTGILGGLYLLWLLSRASSPKSN
ncbi:FecCD family ABC transporter permease [Vibrio sonorensis]|uniref:FecCD family ABC transporter permease n=1 Tax=Vibrio sonorensis TaxID=1004316 RepID=UPI0008DAE3D7|nr:iron chelate uptake ABC transporter family permease subunit [Vibrio sonorensis]